MFILRQHQVQYISGTVPTGAAKYKHGIGNIGPEYKYSAATRSDLPLDTTAMSCNAT